MSIKTDHIVKDAIARHPNIAHRKYKDVLMGTIISEHFPEIDRIKAQEVIKLAVRCDREIRRQLPNDKKGERLEREWVQRFYPKK